MSVERLDDITIVQCNDTAERWHLLCRDGQWFGGPITNCSSASNQRTSLCRHHISLPASWVKKMGGAFTTNTAKFPLRRLWGAQNFDFALNFPQFFISVWKFSDKKKVFRQFFNTKKFWLNIRCPSLAHITTSQKQSKIWNLGPSGEYATDLIYTVFYKKDLFLFFHNLLKRWLIYTKFLTVVAE